MIVASTPFCFWLVLVQVANCFVFQNQMNKKGFGLWWQFMIAHFRK